MIAVDTLWSVFKCEREEWLHNSKSKSSLNIANDLYITRLESDYIALTDKRPEKNLTVELKTNFSFWMFNWGNHETLHLLN